MSDANDAYNVTADELRQFIERFEQLESEKKDVAEQQKELMAEAKGRGYDVKVLRKVIALRKRKPDDIAAAVCSGTHAVDGMIGRGIARLPRMRIGIAEAGRYAGDRTRDGQSAPSDPCRAMPACRRSSRCAALASFCSMLTAVTDKAVRMEVDFELLGDAVRPLGGSGSVALPGLANGNWYLRVRGIATSKRMLLADGEVDLADWRGALDRDTALTVHAKAKALGALALAKDRLTPKAMAKRANACR